MCIVRVQVKEDLIKLFKNMRKFLFILSFCLFCLGESVVSGQTYAYHLVKLASNDGETMDVNENSKIYVTFTNSKGTFYISKSDGSRAGIPDASTGFASGYNNYEPNRGSWERRVRDPQNFQFVGLKNDVWIYKNVRPNLATEISFNGTRVYVSGYGVDYVKFNSDYSRINLIPDFTNMGLGGIMPFGITRAYGGKWTTFIFEQVKAPVIGGDML